VTTKQEFTLENGKQKSADQYLFNPCSNILLNQDLNSLRTKGKELILNSISVDYLQEAEKSPAKPTHVKSAINVLYVAKLKAPHRKRKSTIAKEKKQAIARKPVANARTKRSASANTPAVTTVATATSTLAEK